MQSATHTVAPPVQHEENFPVASWLCPPALRAPIRAIYHFARTADDIADEGTMNTQQRLDLLARYLEELRVCAQGHSVAWQWPGVFVPLAEIFRKHQLPLAPLTDLLSAFEQDVRMSDAGAWYPSRTALLDYCARSANPIGRLLLHLWHIDDPLAQQRSDYICSALQLINFWQDLSVDIPRRRYYLPLADCQRFGLTPTDLLTLPTSPQTRAQTPALVADLVRWAESLMTQGAALPQQLKGQVPWRTALELRAVVHGGVRVLQRIGQLDYNSLHQRPSLGKRDWALVLWRSLRVGPAA